MKKSLFQMALGTDAHARFVARADDLGRALTDDEVLREIEYLIETLPYAGIDDSESIVAQLKKIKIRGMKMAKAKAKATPKAPMWERQPTAAELEAAGQQRLIEKEELAKEEKKAVGQPRKYGEPTKHVSFSLPVSVIEELKILAGLRKSNQTQIILGLIRRELEIDADKIRAYKELLK